jgi:pimeloyl-ACP methyl ester carboxylesterase
MYIAVVLRADPHAYRKAMLSLGLFDSRKRLGEIKAPTLVISGAEDTTVTPDRQKLLAEGIPGAHQVIIPQAGHAVSVEQAEQFNRILLEFLKE